MGKVAYKLKLPEQSHIHPVFLCSILKPYVESSTPIETVELPPMAFDNQLTVTLLTIMATKSIPSASGLKQMVLVQWLGLHPDETSWEDWSVLKAAHHLEDKVWLDGLGNDTNSTKGLQEVSSMRPKRKATTPAYLKDYVQHG